MTSEQILKCMGEIEEKYIAEAENFSPKPVWSRKRLAAVISAAACLCISAGAVALTQPFRGRGEDAIYNETAPTAYTETSEVWVGGEPDAVEENTLETAYSSAETLTGEAADAPTDETGTAVSTSEVIFPAMETTEMTTVNCTTPQTTEDTEEDTPDIAEDAEEDTPDIAEDDEILPDLPLLGSLGEYLDFFGITAETENVKLGYEYVDPEFEVSIFKLTDIDFSEVYPILSRFSDAETGNFGKRLHSSKIVSVVFCLSDGNELLRITIGNDGKGLINPSAYNGSALFEADEEAYAELYEIAAAAGGMKGFDGSGTDGIYAVDEEYGN